MGAATSSNPFQTLTILLLLLFPLIAATTETNAATSSPAVYPYPASELLKPNTGVLVGVLSATFSLTFLFLLYIKHCNTAVNIDSDSQASHVRNNSGIDRDFLESLPVFRFGSLKGQKNGLDCAVCLAKFEDPEVLRLLPKCKHAFHVECVDAWLDEHSTCPLCRYKVQPDDVVVLADDVAVAKSSEGEVDIERGPNGSAGTASFRRSFDSAELGLLERRIVVSPFCSLRGGVHQRWSDFQPRDVLYLTAEIGTWKARARGGITSNGNNNVGGVMENGGTILRSVSEVTGMRSIVYLSR